MLHRPDPDAPASALYVFGRKQDLAFEQDVGGSADQRHHIRWSRADARRWRPPVVDRRCHLRSRRRSQHRTGQITHHVAPDIDAERDHLMTGLSAAGRLADRYQWPGIGATQKGRNAAGDP